MKCFMFTSVGLAILFSLTLCLSSQAMPQDDSATKEVAEEEQAGDPIMKLHRLGLSGSAVRELLGQLEEAEGTQFHKLLANQDEVNTWSFGISPSVSSLDGEFTHPDGRLVQTYTDLGLKFQPVEPAYLARQLGLPEGQGLIVREQDESGAGFKNGFRVGDIVLAVDDVIIGSTTDVMATLAAARGSQSLVKAKRDGDPIELTIKLSEPDPPQSPQRWILGIYLESISELAMAQLNLEGGIVVTRLIDGGAAGKSGIVKHDIITHVAGQPVHSPEQLREILAKSNGEKLKVDFVRGGNKLSVTFAPERYVDQGEINQAEIVGDVKIDAKQMIEDLEPSFDVMGYVRESKPLVDTKLAELFMNELKQADEATATGSKLAELEQQVNELTKAVQKLQESTNGVDDLDGLDDKQDERK